MTLVRTVGDVNGDPIVVVGMGCRFPGAITSADELWQAVIDEQDLVSAAPVDRGLSQNG
jgi:acyl transferase domain-containing protein